MDITSITTIIAQNGADIGIKLLGGIAFWVVGSFLINIAMNLLKKSLSHNKIDITISSYVLTALRVLLRILLIIGILGYFGIQTTTFAALFAAAGVAVGVAWSGLLANLAAGIFLLVLRPFKVGDFISAAGILGEVKAIGIFVTEINTPDNVLTTIGNNKILSEIISNYSATDFRRVELKAQLSSQTDIDAYRTALTQRLQANPQVLANPPIEIEIMEFNPMGPLLTVRPHCKGEHYWSVYFATNRLIYEVGKSFPAPVPAQQLFVHQQNAK